MSEKYFTLFHYSLLPVRQIDIEMRSDLDREGWIRHALAERFSFSYHGGVELEWVPKGNLDEAFYGLIQREVEHALHRSPDEGGDEIVRSEWQGAYVVVDPTSHDLGQRIAVENDVIGRPETLMRYLFSAINQRIDSPYVGEIEPVFDAGTFWSFIAEHGDFLRFIRFHFVTPNMWGTESELEKELKATREDTGAERVDVKLRGEQGVEATSERVTQGVNYAEKGSGSVYAVSTDGSRYRSEDAPKRSVLEVIDEKAGLGIEFLREMKDRILGRE